MYAKISDSVCRDLKGFVMLQRFTVSNNCCHFELSIHQMKKYDSFHKYIKQLFVFSIDNKKCYFSILSFLKDHVILKTGVMHHRNEFHFKI